MGSSGYSAESGLLGATGPQVVRAKRQNAQPEGDSGDSVWNGACAVTGLACAPCTAVEGRFGDE